MNYITFEEYTKMGGDLDEAAFLKYGFEAEMQIKSATFDRIKTPSEAVKRCVVRLIDIISTNDTGKEKVSSFSHDGLSQSFHISSSDEVKKQIYYIINTYLENEDSEDGTPLLYCGVHYE